MASIESIFMYPVAYLPFTSYKEIETDDSAGYYEQIISSQQEQIAGLLETNRFLVEFNGKLLEQTDALPQKIQELLSQIAWLNRQLFGRRSEKLAPWSPTSSPCSIPFLQADKMKTSGKRTAAQRLLQKQSPMERRRNPSVTANSWRDCSS